MDENQTVNPQDEIKEEESFEVDESAVEDLADETTEDGDESNQHQSEDKDDELEKLKQENAKLSRLLKKKSKEDPKGSDNVPSENLSAGEIEKLRLEVKGYDEEQIDFLMGIGGMNALKNPGVVKVLDGMKEEKEKLKAQASGSTKSVKGRTYSKDEISKMPREKLEKLIQEGKIKSI